MHRESVTFNTRPKTIINITEEINSIVQKTNVSTGLCHLFLKHTSCSLIISENSDPNVLKDLSYFMDNLVSESVPYLHHIEGPDDMPAHIRSILTQTSLTLPVSEKSLSLGVWQAIYLWEHRDIAHKREILLTIMD